MTKQELIAQHNQGVLELRQQEFDAKVDKFVVPFLFFAVTYLSIHFIIYLFR